MEGDRTNSSGDKSVTADGADPCDFELHFKSSTGSKFSLPVPDLEEQVGALKRRLAEPSGFAPETMRVIYKGRVLKDSETLRELQDKYGLESGHTMHLVRGVRPGTAANPNSGTHAAAAPSSTSPATSGVPGTDGVTGASAGSVPTASSFAAGGGATQTASSAAPPNTAFNMFGQTGTIGWNAAAGATGMATGGAFGDPDGAGASAGLNPTGSATMQRLQQQMQQQLLANPGAMQEILNSPLMESMAENPELMRTLMMTNPQIREMINQNPEVGHILNDPAVLRQTMQLMRNPRLMQEMMRTSDRAMANIESMPGGFDALRRLYTDIQGSLDPNAALATGAAAGARPGTPNTNPSSETTSGRMGEAFPLPSSWAAGPQTGADDSNQHNWMNSELSEEAAIRATRAILDNPELFRLTQEQMIASDTFLLANPMISAMAAMNPQMMQALQDIQFRRHLFTREFFESTLAMQEAQLRFRRSIHNALRQSGYDPAIAASPSPPTGLGLGGSGAAAGASFADPTAHMTREQLEQHFATQLQQMREMGFFDTDACISALRATGGNVAAALDRLLNNF